MQAPYFLRYWFIGVLAAASIASAPTAAGTSETNPVRTHPAAVTEQAEQRILVKLRSTAAATAHAQALSLQAKPAQAGAANSTMRALAVRSNLTFQTVA